MEGGRSIKELRSTFGGRGWHELADLLEAGYRGEFVALRIVRDSPSQTVAGDLAAKMQVTTARVAAMLRSLEKKGFIRRVRSEEDGRNVIVTLTREGAAALEEREREVDAFLEKMLGKLTEEERRALVCIAEKLFG